jgi:hypothetical protein
MNTKPHKRIAREAEVQAMRQGLRLRAVTFTNKKRQASRQACRNRKDWQ